MESPTPQKRAMTPADIEKAKAECITAWMVQVHAMILFTQRLMNEMRMAGRSFNHQDAIVMATEALKHELIGLKEQRDGPSIVNPNDPTSGIIQ